MGHTCKDLACKFLLCLILGMFCYMFSCSIKKWFSARTGYDSSVIDVENIQYPSISVCKNYALNRVDILPKLFANGTLSYKKKLAMDNIWEKSEVFHFVSHPGMFGMTFPCLTDDGTDPGKPCYFPFRFR